MKSIGSVAACLLLLAVTGSAPALAQTVERPSVGDAVSAKTTVDSPQMESNAVQRVKAGAASDLRLPARTHRLEFSSASRIAQSDGAAPVLVQESRRGGLTWLLVGGSLLGAGLIVGGDAGTALSVGGALLGVYGVYLLVRT